MQPLTNRKLAEVFYRHALPGMTLRRSEPKRAPRPLVKRCERCNAPISANRSWCLTCRDQVVEEIASGKGDPETIYKLMPQSTPEERAAIAQKLMPKPSEPESAAAGAD